MANIYEIGDLYCSYSLSNNGNKKRVPVLHVKDVQIPQDKITFVLGSSGSGKSTFMEAIALMSDTVHLGSTYASNGVYYIPPGAPKFDLIKRCYEGKEPEVDINRDDDKPKTGKKRRNDKPKESVNLDNFRFNNFSFIFQATNLMGNFTAIENVAITDYLHNIDGVNMTAEMAEAFAKNRLVEMLQMTDIRSFDKKPNEYSGGQRQRFAFARALGAQANVLFGDEPTGNLDPHNSFVLLRLLRKLIEENIRKSKENNENERVQSGIRNAILVSHSLELALSFADIIIVIIPPNPRSDNENADLEKTGSEAPDDKIPDIRQNHNDLSCGRTNQLLVYDNDVLKWRTGELLDKDDAVYKRISREISFLLNYEFIPLNNLLVDLYGKIMEDNLMEEHEMEYFRKIKECFTDNFFYSVIYKIKPEINREILLRKIEEIDKEMGFDEDHVLSSFVKENIIHNWK